MKPGVWKGSTRAPIFPSMTRPEFKLVPFVLEVEALTTSALPHPTPQRVMGERRGRDGGALWMVRDGGMEEENATDR